MPEEATGTIHRTIQVVRLLAESSGDLSVKTASERLKLSPSTVHRLLNLLCDQGIVERAPRRRYRIGAELHRVAALIHARADIAALAQPCLQDVVSSLNESCLLALYRPHDRTMVLAACIYTALPLRHRITLNRPDTIAWGASGKVILAHLKEDEVDAALAAAGPSPGTGAALPTRAEIERQLADIRRFGFAITHRERDPSAIGVAAPVFASGGRILGSISIRVPDVRYEKRREAGYAKAVVAAAKRLSAIIGQPG